VDSDRIEACLLETVHISGDAYLTEIASHLIKAGGKRQRPHLTVAAAATGLADGEPVTDDVVRFDPEMVDEIVTTAPSEFTLHARNPAHDVVFGGDRLAFGAVASAPNVADLDGGRRTGNRHDFRNLVRLTQSLNSIHFNSGYPVEPVDLHHSTRHLDATHRRRHKRHNRRRCTVARARRAAWSRRPPSGPAGTLRRPRRRRRPRATAAPASRAGSSRSWWP